MGLHSDVKVEQPFSLDHLSDGLATNCGFDDCFYICHSDSVAGNLAAIDINQETGLAQFAYYRKIGKAGHVVESVFYLHRLVLKDIQVVAIDFDRQ